VDYPAQCTASTSYKPQQNGYGYKAQQEYTQTRPLTAIKVTDKVTEFVFQKLGEGYGNGYCPSQKTYYAEPEYYAPAPVYQQYEAPVYSAPQYSPPKYEAPAYSPPQYSSYEAPAYSPPKYDAPAYSPPQYSSYEAPAYSPPKYSSYEAPAYQPPKYY
jgi:hypothetical protein